MASRIEFQKEMKLLHEAIVKMGSLVEQAISSAVEALVNNDVSLAQDVIDGDDVIDNLERKIDHACVLLIARQQPVAGDLRDITSNLKLITDLERIADHAGDISEHVLQLNQLGISVSVPHDVIRLADLTKTMLKAALDSYVNRSRDQAAQVIRMDKKIDKLYLKLKSYFVQLMNMDKDNIESYVEMLLICKHFERSADHAQNVAEWVLYYVDGRLVLEDSENDE